MVLNNLYHMYSSFADRQRKRPSLAFIVHRNEYNRNKLNHVCECVCVNSESRNLRSSLSFTSTVLFAFGNGMTMHTRGHLSQGISQGSFSQFYFGKCCFPKGNCHQARLSELSGPIGSKGSNWKHFLRAPAKVQ